MKSLEPMKRGDTFAFQMTLQNTDLSPITGASAKLKSQVRDDNETLWADLVVSETSTPGTYLFVADAEITKNWPLVTMYTDIEYTDNEITTSSETLSVVICKDVTKHE